MYKYLKTSIILKIYNTFLIIIAVIEARDICLHLKPLQIYFEEIESADFPDIESRFKPLLHSICLVWANSLYYQTSTRISTLLKEVANLIITEVKLIQI